MRHSMLAALAASAALFALIAPWTPDVRVGAEERRGEKEAERARERELEALQGTWKFLQYEEDGKPVEDRLRRSWIISGRKWAHREKDETSPPSRLEIEAQDNIRRLDIWDGETHIISAIYVRSGDYITLCGNRPSDERKGRPARFETGTPEGGLFMIVCRIER
jgi:uncharacterized protein (TIGR03067 family)